MPAFSRSSGSQRNRDDVDFLIIRRSDPVHKHGTFAGIASVAGFRGLPGASAYCASKSAAITYLKSLRLELRRGGVKVVTVCPGYIDTPLTAVNAYRMPFLIDADTAARGIADAINRGKRFHVLPWQMAVAGWFLRRLPRPSTILLSRRYRESRDVTVHKARSGQRANASTFLPKDRFPATKQAHLALGRGR